MLRKEKALDRITAIEQAIERLEEGAFQRLCNDFLSREGYHGIVALGSKSGSNKTTQGTPDTYFCEIDGKYVFVEYTTQKNDLKNKIIGDLDKCFDETNTGITTNQIIKIIYCHTSSNLSVRVDDELKKYCAEKGVELELIGINNLADQLCRKYPGVVKDHLGIAIDTQQIQSVEDYVKQYNSNDLSASLSTKFQFRQKDVELIDTAFEKHRVVVLSGNAGVGKTRLAIEYANRRKTQKQEKIFCIHNRALGIYDDLQMYFCMPDKYFIIIDDANQLSELRLVMELANRKDEGYDVHILITVRQYALEKIRRILADIVYFEEISVGVLSDDEIKALVKEEFGIVNQHYLDRIADIAKGNARIAMLAGKTASDANKLESINDVSQLYDAYYGKAFREARLDADIQLQTVAGVIAFLNSARMDALDPVLPIMQEQGIDADTFKKRVYELHDLELVDICRDTAVIISDQCFGDYILKYVFFDAKTIRLSVMIDACFVPFRQRTMQAVNNLRSNFNNVNIENYTNSEAIAVWDKWEKEQNDQFWEYVKSFYPIKQIETLMMINARIEEVEDVDFPIEQLDFENKSNIGISDELLSMLDGFARLDNYETAIELYIKYYMKRPDLYMQFYQSAEQYWGIGSTSLRSTTAFLENLITAADNWKNEHIGYLFIAFARKQLHFTFDYTKEGKRNSIVIVHFQLPASKEIIQYRRIIWEQLIKISQLNPYKTSTHGILKEYGQHRGQNFNSIIIEEAEHVCKLLQQTLSPSSLGDCIIAEEVIAVLKSAGAHINNCTSYLDNKDLQLYHLLIGPDWDIGTDYHEWEENRKQTIIQRVKDSDNPYQLFSDMLGVYSSIGEDNNELYKLIQGIDIAAKQMMEDQIYNMQVAAAVIKSKKPLPQVLITVLAALFSWQDNETILNMINDGPESIREYCLFLYYSLIPGERITEKELIGIYYYFQSINSSTQVYPIYRSIDFLLKYEPLDQHVTSSIFRIIYQKREEVPQLAKCYLSWFLRSSNTQSITVFDRLRNDDTLLLVELYLYSDSIDAMFDYDGDYFRKIAEIDNQFLIAYTTQHLQQEHSFYMSDRETKYRSLYLCDDYLTKIDLVIQTAAKHGSKWFCTENSFIRIFVFTEEMLIEKSNEWIKHYIIENIDNIEKERVLFETIVQLPNSRKLPLYKLLLEKNDEYEFFKHIPLTPSSYECDFKVYQNWIDFLKNLSTNLSGIKYLQHKKMIADSIERIKKYIEEEEIRHILEG